MTRSRCSALTVGLAIYYRELRRRGWLGGPIVWISLAAVLGGAIGARVITSWEHLEVYGAHRRPAVQRGHRAQRQEHPRRDRRRLSRDRPREAGVRLHALDRRLLPPRDPGRDGHRPGRAASCPSCRWARRPTCPWGISVSSGRRRGLRPVPRLRRADAPLDALRDPLQPRRHRGDPALPRPGRGPRRRREAVPARRRDLPVPRRVRPRQRAAGPGPDRAAVGPDPDGRPAPAAFRQAGPPPRLPRCPRHANADPRTAWRDCHDGHRHAPGCPGRARSRPDPDPRRQPDALADHARRAVADRDAASSSSPRGCEALRSGLHRRGAGAVGARRRVHGRGGRSEALGRVAGTASVEREAMGPDPVEGQEGRPRSLRSGLAPLRDPVSPGRATSATGPGRSCKGS